MGQEIILENNILRYKVDDNASLIIPQYRPSDRIQYECRLSDGEFVNYGPQEEPIMNGKNSYE